MAGAGKGRSRSGRVLAADDPRPYPPFAEVHPLITRLPALRKGALVFAALIVAASLLNVVQFRSIDRSTSSMFQAIDHNPTGDLNDIAWRACGWCRERYGPSFALGTLAPRSTVIVPTPSPFTTDTYTAEWFKVRLISYGRAASVVYLPVVDATRAFAASRFDPSVYIVASGPGGSKGAPWSLAVDPSRRPATPVAPVDFVGDALASGAYQNADAPPGEFVMLRWSQGQEGSTQKYQDLLIETSVLPADLRAELTQ